MFVSNIPVAPDRKLTLVCVPNVDAEGFKCYWLSDYPNTCGTMIRYNNCLSDIQQWKKESEANGHQVLIMQTKPTLQWLKENCISGGKK